MMTQNPNPWSKIKTYTFSLSCVTALATFALISGPVYANETVQNLSPQTTLASSPNVETPSLANTTIAADTDQVNTDNLSEQESASPSDSYGRNSDTQVSLNEAIYVGSNDADGSASVDNHSADSQPSERSSVRDNSTVIGDETVPTTEIPTETNITGGHYFTDPSGNWFYQDKDGQLLTGAQTVDGYPVYFKDDGQQVKGEFVQIGKDYYYYDKEDGRMVTNTAVETEPYYISGGSTYAKRIRYMGPDGIAVRGWHDIDGERIYFDPETSEQKFFYMAVTVPSYWYPETHRRTIEGKDYYVNLDGTMWRNRFITMQNGSTRYLDDDGQEVTGPQVIDGFELYFHDDGRQAKGEFVRRDGGLYYYDQDQGRLVKGITFTHDGVGYQADQDGHVVNSQIPVDQIPTYRNRFVQGEDRKWYYYDQDGHMVTGPYLLNNHQTYFNDDGSQVKGEFAPDGHFYDLEHGYLVTNRFVTGQHYGPDWYYVDQNGNKLTGSQIIDGKQYYFKENGEQVKGEFAQNGYYYDGNTGTLVQNRFVTTGNNNWYYLDSTGQKLTGLQIINGKTYHFDIDGRQTKGKRVVVNGKGYYFHPDNGELWNNKPLLAYTNHIPDGSTEEGWYYYDDNGNLYKGPITIEGKEYYYAPLQIRRNIHDNSDGTLSFYDENGVKVYDSWVTTKIDFLRPGRHFFYPHYYVDKKGYIAKGFQLINGFLYYFDPINGQLKENPILHEDILFTVDGNLYLSKYVGHHFDAPNHIVTNQLIQLNNGERKGVYLADSSGKLTKVRAFNNFINVGNQWYYVNDKDQLLTGPHVIDNISVYFDQDGIQTKGNFAPDGHFYDKDTGMLVTNRYVQVDENWYYLNDKGEKVIGSAIIDHVPVHFDETGKQSKGVLQNLNGITYYYDKDTGERVSNRTLTIANETYQFDADGRGLKLT